VVPTATNANAKKKERCARFVERVGIDAIKAAVLS